jgi:predicted ester cyclase
MSTEELKAKITRAMDKVYNKGNLNVVDETAAANFVLHNSPFPDVVGREAYKQYITGLRATLTGLHMTFDEVIGEGNTTVARWTLRGTHTGQLPSLPVPPTGKQVTITGCVVTHWAEGRMVEHWNHVNYLGMLLQLGVIPSMGKAGG